MTESQDDEAVILPSLMSYRDLARHDFVPPPAGAIESRAVRRRRRRIVTGAALSVALIGVSTILLVANAVPPAGGERIGSTSSPTPSASQTPGATSLPAEIPITVMLTGYDVWEAGGMLLDGELSGDWGLASLSIYCNRDKPLNYAGSQLARHEVRNRTLKRAGVEVVQRVELADELYQRSLMQWHHDLINDDCAPSIGVATGARPEIIAEGFAGHESFIVRHGGSFWVMVRQGAFTSQILFKNGETEMEMRAVAVKAALRMSRAA